MTSKPSLKEFLADQKTKCRQVLDALPNNQASPFGVNLVIGNEAADLDSNICALLWSYFKQTSTRTNGEDNNNNTLYIPLINILESELKLRRDVISFYKRIIDINDHEDNYGDYLFFNDHIDESFINQLITNNKTSQFEVTLVDHNQLSIFQESLLSEYVTCIIDHHHQDKIYKNVKINVNKPCGSCISVMVEHIQNINPNWVFPNEFESIIPSLILLDTTNMSPTANTVTQTDVQVFNMFADQNIKV